MKASTLLTRFGVLAVVLGLVVVAFWSVGRSSRESDTGSVESAEGRPRRSPHAKTSASERFAKPVDWSEVENGRGSGVDIAMFNKRVKLMSRDELATELNELAIADLSEDARHYPESTLLRELIAKDPEFALKKYIERARLVDSAYGQILPNALRSWARAEPVQAVAWFDEQVAAGLLPSDTTEQKVGRERFETNLMSALFSTYPDMATRRLNGIPKEELQRFLRNISASIDYVGEESFVEMVRTDLPMEEQAVVVAGPVRRLMGGGDFAVVTEYMNRIQATPAERACCAIAVGHNRVRTIATQRRVTVDDLREITSWTTENAPDAVGRLTGELLAIVSLQEDQMTFAEAAANAVTLFNESGDEDILVGFLTNADSRSDSNKGPALALARKISDEKRRDEVFETLK